MGTDPVADFLLTFVMQSMLVKIESTPLVRKGARVLQAEGFIGELSVVEEGTRSILRLWIRYDTKGQSIVRGLKRISKPSRRVYVSAEEIPLVQNGLGVNVLSTSQGLMVDRQARKLHIGGEILCSVW
jgi:small subunit ribosomal protein S8